MSTHFDDFTGRVNHAVRHISNGTGHGRELDPCFENYDGDHVVEAIARRASKNPQLARNLFKRITSQAVNECHAQFGHLSLSELVSAAKAEREGQRARAALTS